MKTITKEEWVAALRSGKYPQGLNYLRPFTVEIGPDNTVSKSNSGWCCLGVAMDAAQFNWDNWHYGKDQYPSAFPFAAEELPLLSVFTQEDLLKYATREGYNFYGTHGNHLEMTQRILANCNDSGMSFEQIAQVIEQGVIPTGDERRWLAQDFIRTIADMLQRRQ